MRKFLSMLFVIGALFPIRAATVYVETYWNGIAASSQSIRILNGATQVGTVTTSSRATATASAVTDISPVYPAGGYSSRGKRDYGCKSVSNLVKGDQIKVGNTWQDWTGDLPAGAQVDSWTGYKTAPLSSGDTVYCKGANVDPVYYVNNYKLEYKSSSYNKPYDCAYHGISVSVQTGGCSVEYSTDNSNWSESNPTYRDVGVRTVYYRIRKDGQYPVSGSETVTIYTGTIDYTATGWTNYCDGAAHGITVKVSNPSSSSNYTIEYSLNGTNWTTSNPTFAEPGDYKVCYRIVANGYHTVTGSSGVKIIALKKIVYSAPNRTVQYTGGNFGILVSVTEPASGCQIRHSNSENGYYSLYSYNSYSQVGSYTIWYQISATGYETVKGSAVLTITPKPITGPNDIENPSYTNYTYTGHQPWYGTSWYTVHYGTNYWGHGWWWVEYSGYGNYTGSWTNWFYIAKRNATIETCDATRGYTGSPLTCSETKETGFVSGEGVESYDVTGSQTEIGYSPNHFTYALKPNTDPGNYNISVVTGRLTVTAITPVSLKYPVRMEIDGTNRVTVGVEETYRARVIYSDGTSAYKYSDWLYAPDDGLIQKSFDGMSVFGSSVDLKAKPAGAGSEHTLSASYSDSYTTAALVTNGLVAWYPFDGDLSDRSFYGKSLCRYYDDHATYAKDRTDTEDRALRFSGDAYGYVRRSNPMGIAQATNALSISAWVKPENYNHLGLCYQNGQFSLRFRGNGDWLFNDTTISCSKALMTNAWQYVTLTWNGKSVAVYLDGVQIGSAAMAGQIGPGADDFYLGRAVQNSATEYFQGAVDDFRIFNRALTADEIAFIMSGEDVLAATSSISVAASKVIVVEPHCRIPVAVDAESATGSQISSTAISFTTGSTATNNAGWFGQYAVNSGLYADDFDYDAAQSGLIPGGGTSWLQTSSLSGAGNLSFWWKTDCEKTYDCLVFKTNGVEVARVSGSTEWKQMSFDLPSCSHVLRWEYVKDGKASEGADAAWLDWIAWTPLDVPNAGGKSSWVNATDGKYDDCVYVTWGVPVSATPVLGYQVWRKVAGAKDATYQQLTVDVTARNFADATAEPGVEYTYEVRARNAQGWGICGHDNGWRRVVLALDPTEYHFSNVPVGEFVRVNVSSNAQWKIYSKPAWLDVAITNGGFVVTAQDNLDSAARPGTITVTCGLDGSGEELSHRERVNLAISQSASIDIGFDCPFADWRTELQITSTNVVADYMPVSVFPADEAVDNLRISFGWRNRSDVAVVLPAVRFRVIRPDLSVALSWQDDGAAVSAGATRELAARSKNACGFWSADHLRMLPPGDYELEAELDPNNTLDDPDRKDNTTFFRFAVRDRNLVIGKQIFSDACWTNLVVSNGNDFAQAPHAATRDAAPVVQFGPYVPMDGVNGRLVQKKKPVDLVLLIDYSGSMDACIAGLMNNIGHFIDRLLVGDANRGISPIEDLRIKIVGFSDFGHDCFFKNWMREYAFTADRKILKQQLDELRSQCYGGGGDGGESSYDALYYLCKGWSTVWDGATQPSDHADTPSPFRDIDQVARAVVLFTDEPPHVELEAPGCVGVDLDGLDAALKAAKINLTIIGDGNYYGKYQEYANNVHWFGDLVSKASADSKRDKIETYPISNFTQDTSKLQELAETIVLQVPTVATVTEPSFAVAVRGEGDLFFRWINDSTSLGTNNTFTFVSEGVTNIVRYGEAEPEWHEEKISFGFDGLHPFKWLYRKLGYDGSVVDCGIVADVLWKPRTTHLEIAPNLTEVDFLGTNKTQVVTQIVEDAVVPCKAFGATYDVVCNAKWRVVGHSDWINLVQDNGEGNGKLVITVATNLELEARTGYITVKAGEDGTAAGTVEETVYVKQSECVPAPTAVPQILTVAVKPRWPWNDTIDIDFRVLLPTDNAPLKVWFRGVNKEGGELAEIFQANGKMKKYFTPDSTNVYTNENSGKTDGYAVCPTSGLYRVTWRQTSLDLVSTTAANQQSWKYEWAVRGGRASFHSPAFGVELFAQRLNVDETPVSKESNTVRLDVRGNSAGGYVMTGTEMIGHPTGGSPSPTNPIDPVAVDTTVLSNGMNCLDRFIVLPPSLDATASGGYSPNNYTHACVINRKDVAIEGGNITNDTVWGADKTHLVRDNVYVQRGATLTIAHGAVVKFCYATRIYIYKDPAVKTSCAERYNIRIRGAYLNGASRTEEDGDDTLCGCNTYDGRDNGDAIMDYCIYAQDWSGDGEIQQTKGSAVLMVQLIRKIFNEKGVPAWSEPKGWRRVYYTMGEECGALPEPPTVNELKFFGWSKSGTGVDDIILAKNSTRKSDPVYSEDVVISPNEILYKPGSVISKLNAIQRYPGNDDWEDGWDTIEPISLRQDASSGTIILDPPSVVYDGKAHKEDVAIVSVTLNDAPLVSAYYKKDDGTNDYLNSGNYDVTVKFTAGYENSPTGTFTVLQRPVKGGEVLLSTNSALYCPAVDGGVSLPSVTKVLLPMGEDGAMVEIPERDRAEVYAMTNWYDLVQDETHYWPRPGIYHVEVSFNGNYSGTLTNSFEILHNPEYDFTSPRYATNTADGAVARAKALSKRILYVGGEVPDDSATAYVKSWITDDPDTNEWVIANFVCWTDNATNSTFAKYSAGLGLVDCPLICVFNPDDLETPVVRLCGCPDKATLCKFLSASLTASVDAKAVKISFKPDADALVYDEERQTPTADDLVLTYGGVTLSSDQYTVIATNDSTDAGTYALCVRMNSNAVVNGYVLTGETAAVSYRIMPCAVYDGMDATVRAKLGVGLVPPAAAYNGEIQMPGVTSVVEIASTNYFGMGSDWFNIGTHIVQMTFDGNYKGTISEAFAITAMVVNATVELDRLEEFVSSKGTVSLRPNVLKVYDASRTYIPDTDYTVDYGAYDYVSPGTNTIKVTFCGNYAGEAKVLFVIHAVGEVVTTLPSVEGDDGATVTGSVESGFVVVPSAGNDCAVITIPAGVPPSKVTVRVSPSVKIVKPKEVGVCICREGQSYNITNCLDFATEGKAIILSNATVKAAIVKEILDPSAGAELDLNPTNAFMKTAPTYPGLLYTFSEGVLVKELTPKATKTGDGKPWELPVTVKGGTSGFYSIGVDK